eukprot:g2327.t1
MENTWRNTGRVYHAASQRAQARGVVVPNVAKHIEELLAPLRQHLRRDSHPERLALLELLSALEVECGEEKPTTSKRSACTVACNVVRDTCASTCHSLKLSPASRSFASSDDGVPRSRWKWPLTMRGPAFAGDRGTGSELSESVKNKLSMVRERGEPGVAPKLTADGHGGDRAKRST